MNKKKNYSSFEEVAEALGYKSSNKKNSEKIEKKKEVFLSKNKCKGCGEPLTFISGTNIMTCTNDKCKGIKIKRVNAEGEEYVAYTPSFFLLNKNGERLANEIFD